MFAGRDKGVDSTSILQPPNLWYGGKRKRVSQENKGGVCHDVWMWTLGPLVDPETKLESLPDLASKARPRMASKSAAALSHRLTLFGMRKKRAEAAPEKTRKGTGYLS